LNSLRAAFDRLPMPIIPQTLNFFRDDQRNTLYSIDSRIFPRGHQLTALFDIGDLYLPIRSLDTVDSGFLSRSSTSYSSIIGIAFDANHTYTNVPLRISGAVGNNTDPVGHYELVAGIYYGADHFTARISLFGQLYWYDSIVSGYLQAEDAVLSPHLWTHLARRRLHLGLYIHSFSPIIT
jgi:hypothetical protein